ncbi:AAA domain-containing protein [Aminipila terrae]|uniref:DNA helicase n=1 Tax=Aminipila terrae TaxID=2697030 RepID=A0A6P1MN18_9FIRM|nr:AAA domain-containing protein [Aminipila terrae]QHI73488.1 DNA helicase [Aminipila terrae]
MYNNSKEMTQYFRSAVAAQANRGIDFKTDNYYILDPKEVLKGKINPIICKNLFVEANKNTNESKKNSIVNVIICAKTIKTIFEANEKVQEEIEELTGVYYIPAMLNDEGLLLFNEGDKKLPWFPREYLWPMVESKLAIGDSSVVDNSMSDHVDQIEKIKSWMDYADFFMKFYESVTESEFGENSIRNLDSKESVFELEKNMYIFIDNTVNATFHILNLYNHLQQDEQEKSLYNNFISTEETKVHKLIENECSKMQIHCGQMSGEHSLSPSQREAVNHFNCMGDGEILAVNGPPGTGKTTLLQTIVADMYVKRAIKKEKAPLIVASSTNNQAVTNIITSFGNIKKMGISNVEERWIEGVDNFAAYFPSTSKIKEANSKGYQYTSQKGEFFVSDIEDKKNIDKSMAKILRNCNEYFQGEYKDVIACQAKLHDELLYMEKSKKTLLSLAQEISQYDLNGEKIDMYLESLALQIEETQKSIDRICKRISEWEKCYKRIPLLYRLLKFINSFSRKIQTEFRLFINNQEQSFLNEYMGFDEIREEYSHLYNKYNNMLVELRNKKTAIEKIKGQYDEELKHLKQHNIELHGEKDEKYNLELDYINNLIDKKHRYIEFWLAVHYFECRWVSGEDELSEKQKGKNFKNVLEKFYNRLGMITPCLVMTFFMLPKQFLAFGDQRNFFLYNYIDLLIVDEAGQVSPEIAAGAFSLAKKAIVVGDVYQIEPVWSVNRALDKALALSNGAISTLGEFELLEQVGLNTSCSSVMKVAAKCCKYEKFSEKGLLLREHRRCYDEIIDYCNELVYKGNLQPMRGEGKNDEKIAIKKWPQMGFKQIETEYSIRKGSSRINRIEAEQIVQWLRNNFDTIEKAYPTEEKENLVGIITPFKAQVKCIELELKKQMPTNYSKISVGTVHTFQGAERKLIILSTVYGKQEGCFFIDANKSLMNVAVSRAKDNFFVFGDINCLKDTENSASGLLKKCIYKYSIQDTTA